MTQEYANWIVRRGWCPDLEMALATIGEYEDEWMALTSPEPLEWIGRSECEFWSALRQRLFGFDTEQNKPEYPFIEGMMIQADGYYVQSWHGLFYIADGKVAGMLNMPGQEM